MAIEIVTVMFDPTAVPPVTLITSTGNPYLYATEDTQVIAELAGTNGASFASTPLNTIVTPPGSAGPQMGPLTTTICTFTVPLPPHHFTPWVLSFNINYNGVNNITSTLLYVVRHEVTNPEIPLEFTLAYDAGDGSFNLNGGPESNSATLTLESKMVLINAFPISLTIVPNGATFPTSSPILWSSGVQPDWITPLNVVPADDGTLTFSITEEAEGHSIGLQFAVVVPDNQGQAITILSPDPILINTTIGDG